MIFMLTKRLMEGLGISTQLIRSETLGIYSSKSDLVLDLCKAMSARTYLSGPLGRSYLNLSAFEEAGIEIAYHDYKHPVYPQHHSIGLLRGEFVPNLSVIDLLFNCGPDSGRILSHT